MSQHYFNSSFREKLIEHLFVGELLKRSWLDGDCSLEMSLPEVDRSGFDLLAECNRFVRQIQLKGSNKGSKTARQKVHVALTARSDL